MNRFGDTFCLMMDHRFTFNYNSLLLNSIENPENDDDLLLESLSEALLFGRQLLPCHECISPVDAAFFDLQRSFFDDEEEGHLRHLLQTSLSSYQTPVQAATVILKSCRHPHRGILFFFAIFHSMNEINHDADQKKGAR